MVTTKLKLGAMTILLLGCVVMAAGLAVPQAPPERQPKNKAKAKHSRKDRYGDPLPEGAIARLGTVRLRHPNMVASAVFTCDGKTAIVGDSGGSIVFWDVATGQKTRELPRAFRGEVIYALAISSDGKTLGSSGGNHLSLWDVATGQLLSQTEVTKDRVRQLLFTPDGRTLAIRVQSNLVLLWDVARKKKLHELKGHTGTLECMALSPDGKTLASASWQDPHVRLWDIASGKEKLHLAAEDKEVRCLAYSPDGKTIASIGERSGLAFFDSNTGERLHEVKDYYGRVKAISYSPDGKTLIGTDRRSVHVLDAASGKHLRKFDAPPRTMVALTLSPDGKTLATFWGGANTFDLWDIATGKLRHPAPGHRYSLTSLEFSADGRQVFSAAGIFDFPLRVWDARTGERLYELGDNVSGANGLALSPDGKLLAACGYNDHTIRLWDPMSRKERRILKGHADAIDSVAWSGDGKMLTSVSFQDKSLRIWDSTTSKQRWTTPIDVQWAPSLALSPADKIVAVGGFPNGRIRLWSTDTGKELPSITTPHQFAGALAFSPDGSALASGGLADVIHLWTPATGRLLRQWRTKTGMGWINRLSFTRDGRTLVSGHNDGSIHLWEAGTGKERTSFRGHRGGVRAVTISRDSRYVTSGGEDTTIRVWDAADGVRPGAVMSAEQLRSLWEDLNAGDAGRAYRAMWRIALTPERALPFLAERVRPIAPLDASRQKHVKRLLVDLENDSFPVREKAESELAKMGSPIEPTLRKALGGKPAPEARRRIEAVLEKITEVGSAERLHTLRALEAIEHMNTPQARRLLESLANGASGAWLTEEARAICKRLAEQSVTAPQR